MLLVVETLRVLHIIQLQLLQLHLPRENCHAHSVSVTGIFAAGFPIVVSSTWQVIGGFFSVAMFFAVCPGFGELERWFERASMREVALEVGMRLILRFNRLTRAFEARFVGERVGFGW